MPVTKLLPIKCRLLRGFTLTEAAIVLAIVGLVLGGIWVAYDMVQENNKVTKMQRQILTIVQNVRTAYAQQGGFTGVPNHFADAGMIAAGIIPPDMVDNSFAPPQIRTPWGTRLNFLVWDSTSFWIINYNGAPKGVCAALEGRFVGNARDPGFLHIWRDDGVWGDPNAGQSTVGAVINYCNGSGGPGGSGGFGLRFALK